MKSRLLIVSMFFLLVAASVAGQQVKRIQNVGLGNISVIEFGQNGDTWAGSAGQGVAMFSVANQAWTYFNTTNTPQLHSDSITSIAVRSYGGVNYAFIGTTNGVALDIAGVWSTISSLPAQGVSGLFVSSSDTLWVYTTTGGIAIYDSTGSTNLRDFNTGNSTIPFDSITCAESGSTACGAYCAGTANHGCFWTSSGDLFKTIDTSVAGHLLVDNRVTALFMENACLSRLVGTQGGFSSCPPGMNCDDFTTINSSLPENYITAISEDCKGQIWIGTKDSGVILLQLPSTFGLRITTANGLPSNQVTSIRFDGCTGEIGTADGNISKVDTSASVIGILSSTNDLKNESLMVQVYPQPASNQIHFVLDQGLSDGQLYITDVHGNDVQHYDFKNTLSLIANVSNLADGMYFYRILSGNEMVKTGKLQVAK